MKLPQIQHNERMNPVKRNRLTEADPGMDPAANGREGLLLGSRLLGTSGITIPSYKQVYSVRITPKINQGFSAPLLETFRGAGCMLTA